MISYAENPNIKIRVIETVEGDMEYRRNCKHMMDRKLGKMGFYKIGRDCFEFGGKWYRKDSGFILFDSEKKEWVLARTSALLSGVIGIAEDGTIELGHFSPNRFNNVKMITPDRRYNCIDVALLKAHDYIENVNDGVWYSLESVGGKGTGAYKQITTISTQQNYRNKGYNIEDNGHEFEEKIKDFADYPTLISKDVQKYARFLGDTSFGMEVELSQGFIPNYIQSRMGIVMCRDGSISGGEAVTVPMSGAKGLQNIKDIANDFKTRAYTDIHCSLHYHLGNIPTDKAYICALYVLAYKIQDEVFTMFPYYKTNPTNIKRKNYCQKLRKMHIHPLKNKSKEDYDEFITHTYNSIFEFLSDGVPQSQFNNKKIMRHPITEKWSRPSRYFWINLQNMIFSPRRTAEMRIHHSTTNAQKMTLWLFMCNAIVRYAEINQEKILMTDAEISFKEVLNYYADTNQTSADAQVLSSHLIQYFENRRDAFAKDYERGDFISNGEVKADKKFVFQRPLF